MLVHELQLAPRHLLPPPPAAGLGMWAARRPTLSEWSRSLVRSAWVRARHAARTSAAAAAGSLGGAAAAAGGALTQAAAAGADGAARAARAASSAAAQAAAAGSEGIARATGLLGRSDGREHDGGNTTKPPSAGQVPQSPADADTVAGGPAVEGSWWRRAQASLRGAMPGQLRR